MDTIITFNYDTVVEKAASLTDRPYFPSSSQNLWNPTHLTTPKDPLPALLKLHGSADWFSDGDTSKSTLENVHAYRMKWTAYFEDKFNILIGTPGLAKPSLSEGLFKPMWEKAAKAIRDAHVVSLVGYSIPATDNLAKALIENNLAAAKNLLAVNVILGPDANSPIAKRAVEILSQARRCNGQNVSQEVVKLWFRYSQDFLHKYRPKSASDVSQFNG